MLPSHQTVVTCNIRQYWRQLASYSSWGWAHSWQNWTCKMVPVHPDDHPLLSIRWGQEVYIDIALPFGLRSAPKIFSAVSDALAWILQSKGVRYQLHYLDDFLLLGPPDTAECTIAMQRTLTACKELGVPIAAHKT